MLTDRMVSPVPKDATRMSSRPTCAMPSLSRLLFTASAIAQAVGLFDKVGLGPFNS